MTVKTRISRSKWPWGRVSPSQRAHDLEVMIARARKQIPIIEDQAKEAIRRIELNVEYLEDQLKAARELEIEAVRAENKELAYELAMLGDDRIDQVGSAEDQYALRELLKDALVEMRKRAADTSDPSDELDGFFTS